MPICIAIWHLYTQWWIFFHVQMWGMQVQNGCPQEGAPLKTYISFQNPARNLRSAREIGRRMGGCLLLFFSPPSGKSPDSICSFLRKGYFFPSRQRDIQAFFTIIKDLSKVLQNQLIDSNYFSSNEMWGVFTFFRWLAFYQTCHTLVLRCLALCLCYTPKHGNVRNHRFFFFF